MSSLLFTTTSHNPGEFGGNGCRRLDMNLLSACAMKTGLLKSGAGYRIHLPDSHEEKGPTEEPYG